MSVANLPLLDVDTALAIVRLAIQARKEGELAIAFELEAILGKYEKARLMRPHRHPRKKVWS